MRTYEAGTYIAAAERLASIKDFTALASDRRQTRLHVLNRGLTDERTHQCVCRQGGSDPYLFVRRDESGNHRGRNIAMQKKAPCRRAALASRTDGAEEHRAQQQIWI